MLYECKPKKSDCQCRLTSSPTESQKGLEIVIGETDSLPFDLDISNIGDDLAFGVDVKFDFEWPIPGFDQKFPITSRDGLSDCDGVRNGDAGVSISWVS